VSSLIGSLAELPSKILPIPPVLTADQVASLKTDATPSPKAPGLKQLGITDPVAVEGILPTYLYRYRKGGQFAESAAPMVTGSGA
jgi:NADH dehydrogenase